MLTPYVVRPCDDLLCSVSAAGDGTTSCPFQQQRSTFQLEAGKSGESLLKRASVARGTAQHYKVPAKVAKPSCQFEKLLRLYHERFRRF